MTEMLRATTPGDEKHATGLADPRSVPNALGDHDRGAAAQWHFAKTAWLLQQQHGRARQQVDELVGLGVHFPVRPVRGALELGDEPAPTEAIELRLGQGPEPLTAGNRLSRSGRGEMDVGLSGIERHGQLPFGRTFRAR